MSSFTSSGPPSTGFAWRTRRRRQRLSSSHKFSWNFIAIVIYGGDESTRGCDRTCGSGLRTR
jgi:hypothetical protein